MDSAIEKAVEASPERRNLIPIIFPPSMDPVFEVSPVLTQRTARGVYEKNAHDALWRGSHGFGCAGMGAASARPPGLSYIFHRRHY